MNNPIMARLHMMANDKDRTQRMTKQIYKAKCNCGETFKTTNIDHIDQWCQTHNVLHDRLPQLTKDPIIEVWETQN